MDALFWCWTHNQVINYSTIHLIDEVYISMYTIKGFALGVVQTQFELFNKETEKFMNE